MSAEKPTIGVARRIIKEAWKLAEGSRLLELSALLGVQPWLVHERAPRGTSGDSFGGLPFLHIFCSFEDFGLAEQALQLGAAVNVRDDQGQTALHRLLNFGKGSYREAGSLDAYWRFINRMIDVGARCDGVDGKGEPLWVACNCGNPPEVVERLLKNGSPVDGFDGEGSTFLGKLVTQSATDDPMFRTRHQREALKLVLAHGADPNLVGPNFMFAPLAQALALGDLELADLLVSHGAKPDLCDRFGRGFLHHATHRAAVPWLTRNGIPVDVRDHNGVTPLAHVAEQAFSGNYCVEDVMVALISAGADPNAEDYQGPGVAMTPRQMIEERVGRPLTDALDAIKSSTARRLTMDILRSAVAPQI